MREVKCGCCGQLTLVPDPPARSTGERREFERQWDQRYRDWCDQEKAKNPDWSPPVLETIRPGSQTYSGRRRHA